MIHVNRHVLVRVRQNRGSSKVVINQIVKTRKTLNHFIGKLPKSYMASQVEMQVVSNSHHRRHYHYRLHC